MGLTALFLLERPQEIDDFLLLLSAQLIETFDDLICLTATALDLLWLAARPSMQKKDTLADAPEGSCPELVGAGAGAALRDAVGEAFAHTKVPPDSASTNLHKSQPSKPIRIAGIASRRGAPQPHFPTLLGK